MVGGLYIRGKDRAERLGMSFRKRAGTASPEYAGTTGNLLGWRLN